MPQAFIQDHSIDGETYRISFNTILESFIAVKDGIEVAERDTYSDLISTINALHASKPDQPWQKILYLSFIGHELAESWIGWIAPFTEGNRTIWYSSEDDQQITRFALDVEIELPLPYHHAGCRDNYLGHGKIFNQFWLPDSPELADQVQEYQRQLEYAGKKLIDILLQSGDTLAMIAERIEDLRTFNTK